MPVNRADRVGDQMKRELSELLRTGLRDPRILPYTGVTAVEVTRDLSHATAYVSVLGDEAQQEACLAGLKQAAAFLRRELANRIRLHHSPELHFKLDRSVQEGLRMSQLIDEALAQDAKQRAEALQAGEDA